MQNDLQLLVIETNAEGATELEGAAKKEGLIRFQKNLIRAQVGDPDTWTFVAELTKSALPILSAAILLLIRQRKIEKIKIGKHEFHGITADQFERVLQALQGGGPSE
jgi:hypothetical protein